MVPIEWPIAGRSDDRGQLAARRAGSDRLSVVRADFFLDSGQRLTEQERSLMTAMLGDLVQVIADEIAAELALDQDGDGDFALLEHLSATGLLDLPPLIAALLRRAEEQRVISVIRARQAGNGRRFLHRLVADADPDVAAAAMALVLARSRRRDRFDSPRIDLDDVPAEAVVTLVYRIAAAIGRRSGTPERSLTDAAAKILSGHDEGKRLEALNFGLVHALDRAGRLDEAAIAMAFDDGEAFIGVEALARAAGIEFETAWSLFVAGAPGLARLLRLSGVSRQAAAELLSGLGDFIPGGPGETIADFDSLSEEQVAGLRAWLRLHPAYRDAAIALKESDGHAPD
ncbi:DUF2336 domain-containing protein [Sphingomonas sinipercae]|uniref:DUF2336 domain-containing protein n=1 Tax=Sphingomonas sinipercae TaxID=2714944 RepID=A0A6G7ZMS3_9SPHN|nr:DUF2336 domain-containing protein [Sphingomonas sinipercae]QIL02218.1 DUF2336 domain-containing protein [Sphingomonas sinipercae]